MFCQMHFVNIVFCRYIIYINFPRCVESGVSYLSSKVERITESSGGHRLVACEHDTVVPCRYDWVLFCYSSHIFMSCYILKP